MNDVAVGSDLPQAGVTGSARHRASDSHSGLRHAVLVLGMHRSGSSAITRFLNFLGCTLPSTLMPANPTNPAGHWESDAICAFNDRLLSEAGSFWNDWLPIHSDWSRSCTYRHNLSAAGDLVRSEYGDAGLFVLKDPRICRIAPFWYEALELQKLSVLTLIPLRHPLEVSASLHKRDGIHPAIGQLMWLRHVVEAERASRGRRRVFSHYDDLLADAVGTADKVADGFGIVWPRSRIAFANDARNFLSPEFRHHVQTSLDDLLPWASEVYAVLCRWAQEGEQLSDYAKLDEIRDGFNRGGANFVPHVIALTSAQSALRTLQADAETSARQSDADRNAALAAMAEANAQVEAERQAAAIALADAQSQAEAERQAAAIALAEAHARIEAADQQRVTLDARLAEASERADAAAGERNSLMAELRAAKDSATAAAEHASQLADQLAMVGASEADLRAALTQAESRVAIVEAENKTIREELLASHNDLERTTRALDEQRSAYDQAMQTVAELTTHLQAARQDSAAAMESAGELRRLHAFATSQIAVVAEELEQAREALHAANTANQEWASRCESQSHEIAINRSLAGRLSNAEMELTRAHARAEEQAGIIDFLRGAMTIAIDRNRWFAGLAFQIDQSRRNAALTEQGLFDAKGYLARYPDVARDARDPLLHYVRHGIDEGRVPI